MTDYERGYIDAVGELCELINHKMDHYKRDCTHTPYDECESGSTATYKRDCTHTPYDESGSTATNQD